MIERLAIDANAATACKIHDDITTQLASGGKTDEASLQAIASTGPAGNAADVNAKWHDLKAALDAWEQAIPDAAKRVGADTAVKAECQKVPASVRSAASSHSGGTHARCVITLVRCVGGRPGSLAESRSSASSRSIWATFAANYVRPARSGRPRSAAPTSRPRSSGIPAGRAATRRRSRRRATTAPRLRPRA